MVLLVSNAPRIKAPQRKTHRHQRYQHAAHSRGSAYAHDDDAYTPRGRHDELSFLAWLHLLGMDWGFFFVTHRVAADISLI